MVLAVRMWHAHIHEEEDGTLDLDDGLDASSKAAPRVDEDALEALGGRW